MATSHGSQSQPLSTRRDFLKAAGITGVGLAAFLAGFSTQSARSASLSAGKKTGRAATNELIVAQIGAPTNLDVIQRSGNTADTEILQQIYNELLHYNYSTRRLEPDLAESWTYHPATLTWEVKLREGVMFHKGYGEFTADDVAFNVNYTVQKHALRSNHYLYVKSAKATSKYVVEYYLEKPFAPFAVSTLSGLAGQMVSKKAYQEMGEDKFARNPIGTGPWQLESWTPSQLVVTRNKNYYKKGLPYIDKITFIPVADPTVRREKIEAGEVDFMGQPSFFDLPGMEKDQNLLITKIPGNNWDYVAFNLKDKSLPFQNQDVRQAIAYAINRQAIVQGVYFGNAIPTDSPLPSGYLGHEPGPIMYPYQGNVAKAKALMQQAGMASGFTTTCITGAKPFLQRELQVVADQLKSININLKIQDLDDATYHSRRDSTNFEMQLSDISIVSPDSDDALVNFQYSKGNNNFGWVSPEVDQLIVKASQTVNNDAARAADYSKVVKLTVEGAGFIYNLNYDVIRIMQKGLTGFVPTPYDQQIYLETMRWE